MTDDQFSNLLAALEQIRLALEPGLLDWLSGLVVPLLVGGLSVWVAFFSVRVARRSNELAVLIQQEHLLAEARRLRIPFATYVQDLVIPRLFRQLTNQQVDTPGAEQLQKLNELRAASDEPTAGVFETWMWSRADAEHDASLSGSLMIEEFLIRSQALRDRAALWIQDPQAAVSLIEGDAK